MCRAVTSLHCRYAIHPRLFITVYQSTRPNIPDRMTFHRPVSCLIRASVLVTNFNTAFDSPCVNVHVLIGRWYACCVENWHKVTVKVIDSTWMSLSRELCARPSHALKPLKIIYFPNWLIASRVRQVYNELHYFVQWPTIIQLFHKYHTLTCFDTTVSSSGSL